MEPRDRSGTRHSLWYNLAGCVVVFWGCALLNGVGGLFQIAGGVSFVYPASAAAVLGGIFFGWWGVAAAFLGYLASPWGIAEQGLNALFLSGIGALQAAIPTVAPLPEQGSSFARTRRFFFYAVTLNTFISAILGVAFVAYRTGMLLTGHEVGAAFLGWFLGDSVAICLLAVPPVLLIRPHLLVSEDELDILREWLHRWRFHVVLAAAMLADGALMELTTPSGVVSIHWLGSLLLGPVLVAATAGGTGAGLMTAAVAGMIYVVQVLRLIDVAASPALLGEMLSAYVNIAVLTVAAVIAGGYAARARLLLHTLDEHRTQLQRSFESAVMVLAAAIEAKDPTTEGHVRRVARLATRVGRRLGLNGHRLEVLRYAAILHDIGKIGVPESVLNKPGALAPAEREQMETHVTAGVEIIEKIDLLAPAIPFIRYHQERWDGATTGRFPGYFGLKGEEIPLEARIIAAVDAFDAMTNDRPYRRAMPLREAREELWREAGRQFDPHVVEALLRVVAEPPDGEASGRWPAQGRLESAWGFIRPPEV